MPAVVARLRHPAAALGVIASVLGLSLYNPPFYGGRGLVGPTIALVAMACGNTVFSLLTFSGLRVVGLISYDGYLLHGVVINLARPVATRGNDLRYWAVVIVLAEVVPVACLVTYRLSNSRLIRLEERFRRTHRTAELVRAELTAATRPAPASHTMNP